MDNLINYLTDNNILIVPNNLRETILKTIRDSKKINIKIFDLKEFISRLTFTYDEKTIYNVMNKYNINYNISRLYLDNIKYIDSDSNNYKLSNLYKLKIEVDSSLIKDNLFHKLLKNKKIIVYGYDYINKYDLNVLNKLNNIEIIKKEVGNYVHDVYSFNNLEDECIFVLEKICDLIKDGENINNIFISNLDDNYRQVLTRLSKIYNIPFNLKYKNSIYETNIGKYFIDNLNNNIEELLTNIREEFNMDNPTNYSIYKKIINVLNKFYFTSDYVSIKNNIIEVMKNTYIENRNYINAINEINIIDNEIDSDNHVFLLGFNLNKFPVTKKDEDYITDDIKPDTLEKSYEINIINKDIYYNSIKSIKNLYISYSLKYLSENYYPSILIDEYNLKTINYQNCISTHSDDINKLYLAEYLDNLVKYNEYSVGLELLYNNYEISYKKYDNRFSGIDKNNLYKYLNNKLNLSYSSMDTYYHCSFKYYLKNILKIDKYEDTIQAYIGNLYHYVLSKAFLNDFDFDECVKHYITNNSYSESFKNKFFINNVIKDLKNVINTIKCHNSLSNMNEAFYEKEINVEKSGVLNTTFKGFIDKILKKDNYIVLIDYKTYMLDIKLNYLPYGLSMQLPVYLYLTKNIDKNYEIIGFYLQQVLFGKFNKENGKSLKELIDNNLKLKGYSLGNEEKLSIFDSSYLNSEIIHGMKLTNKGFSSYSRVLTEKQIDNIYKITDEKINECISGIENTLFHINPKMINDKNIGCQYCKFKDICYVTNRDIVKLEDIKDLSFLD